MLRSIGLLWQLVSPHLKAQRNLLLLVLLLTLASTASGLLAPWLLKRIVDSDMASGQAHAIWLGVFKAGGAYLLAHGLWAGQQALAALATERIFVQVKTHMLQLLLDKPRSFFDRLPDAEIALRLNTNLREAAQSFRDDIMAGSVELLLALSLVGVVLATHWQAGLLLVVALVCYAGIVWAVDEPLRGRAARSREARSQQNTIFLDILAAARDIKVFNLGRVVAARFAESVGEVARKQALLARFSALLRSSFGLLGALLTLTLVSYCAALIGAKDPRMSAGLLVALLTISVIFVATLNQILTRVNRLVVAEPSLRRIVDMVRAPLVPQQRAEGSLLTDLQVIPDSATIEFIDLHYTQAGGPKVFSGFNLKIETGQKIAIMGPSGSGKSLLLDLLMRLREPEKGRVLFSGIDIAKIPSDIYYSAFGFVGQNSHMMRLSLREFLSQGWPGQTEADLWRILELVKLDNFVKGLPKQLDTAIGPDGWSFASGQRQRLMVARALLRDPQVLLLDEFTGSLDARTEAELIDNVLTGSPGRTVICTTYFPRVAEHFDQVITLREAGSHAA